MRADLIKFCIKFEREWKDIGLYVLKDRKRNIKLANIMAVVLENLTCLWVITSKNITQRNYKKYHFYFIEDFSIKIYSI